jgi:hypothetical protein
MCFQQRHPLLSGVVTFRGKLATSSARADRLSKLSMGADVGCEVER